MDMEVEDIAVSSAKPGDDLNRYQPSTSPTTVQIDAPVPITRDPNDNPGFGSFDSEATGSETIEGYVRDSLSQLENRLEVVLDNISDELAGEVSRERQHLMLMQEQVDKQGHSLQKEFGDLHKALEQEKTQRTLVQQRARDESQLLGDNLKTISKEIEELRMLIQKMKTPWTTRLFNDICGMFKHCSIAGSQYTNLPSQ